MGTKQSAICHLENKRVYIKTKEIKRGRRRGEKKKEKKKQILDKGKEL